MKARIESLMGGAALSCVLLASCGGNSNNMVPPPKPPSPPPVSMTMDLDTAAVLAIVKTQTSETAAPLQVDNGAVAVVPVGDETGSPISVDGS
ncbi:MAG: hypothetical protein WBF89_00365 [Steroidobacteraceae bacterium]|jgi:hypothetical protein